MELDNLSVTDHGNFVHTNNKLTEFDFNNSSTLHEPDKNVQKKRRCFNMMENCPLRQKTNRKRCKSESGAIRHFKWAQITKRLLVTSSYSDFFILLFFLLTPFALADLSTSTSSTSSSLLPTAAPQKQQKQQQWEEKQQQSPPKLPNNFTLEVVTLIDPSMTQFHKFDTFSYVRVLLSIAAKVFLDPPLKRRIRLKLIGFEELRFNVSTLRDTLVNPEKSVIKELRRRGQNLIEDPDAILILTRKDLCWAKRCQFSGFAFPGNVCSGQNVAVVKDEGFYSGFSIAHELGHLLNLNHGLKEETCDSSITRRVSYGYWNTQSHSTLTSYVDFDEEKNKDRRPELMSWSPCSNMFLDQFLESGNGSCLTKKTQLVLDASLNLERRLPGQIYTLNEQCEKLPGENGTWAFFRSCQTDDFVDCSTMSCVVDTPQGEKCRKISIPWADGTLCNSTNVETPSMFSSLFRTSDVKVCKRGSCIYFEDYNYMTSAVTNYNSRSFNSLCIWIYMSIFYFLSLSESV